jgi:hypothetical protein
LSAADIGVHYPVQLQREIGKIKVDLNINCKQPHNTQAFKISLFAGQQLFDWISESLICIVMVSDRTSIGTLQGYQNILLFGDNGDGS